jgi:hypothetical protein
MAFGALVDCTVNKSSCPILHNKRSAVTMALKTACGLVATNNQRQRASTKREGRQVLVKCLFSLFSLWQLITCYDHNFQYIQARSLVSNRSIHPLLIIRKLEIAQIPLNTRVRASVPITSNTVRGTLTFLQIIIASMGRRVPKRRSRANRIRLHPQLPHDPDTVFITAGEVFLICVHFGNASRVTSWPRCEELIVPNTPVGAMIAAVVVIDGGFALR